jgi:hypothetical protein
MTKIAGSGYASGSGSTPKSHGSARLIANDDKFMFALLLVIEDVESVPLRRGSNPAGDAVVPDATRHPHAALERTTLRLLCGG